MDRSDGGTGTRGGRLLVTGEALALVTRARRWTRNELAEAVERERSRLASVGALKGSVRCVAFDAHPTHESVVRLLALFDAGVCAAPLHPRMSAADRARRLACLAPVADLDTEEVRVRGKGGESEDGVGGEVRWRRRPAAAARQESATRSVDPTADASPQAILFTSGSSGVPRAVELSRGAFRAAAASSADHLGWEPDDRWLCCLPLAHVGGLSIVVRCMLAGRPIVLTGGFEPATVARMMDEEQVTLASFVPTMLHQLFAAEPAWRPPASLRAVLLGGAAAGARLWEEIGRRGVPALATYGMTETCAQVATGTPEDPRRLVPLRGISLRIVEGRIEVGGPTLCTAVGEMCRAGEVGDRAPRVDHSDLPNPWTPDGYLRTADLGRLEDGVLRVLGRADDVIVTGGENVMPGKVEEVLERHPAVRRALVFGVRDEEWGALVAVAIEARSRDARPTIGELRAWLEPRLAAFERPRRLAWVEALPRTATGKLDRAAAKQDFRDRLEAL